MLNEVTTLQPSPYKSASMYNVIVIQLNFIFKISKLLCSSLFEVQDKRRSKVKNSYFCLTLHYILLLGTKACENFVGNGENAGNQHGNQHFLFFPQCFLRAIFPGVVKTWNSVVKG